MVESRAFAEAILGSEGAMIAAVEGMCAAVVRELALQLTRQASAIVEARARMDAYRQQQQALQAAYAECVQNAQEWPHD